MALAERLAALPTRPVANCGVGRLLAALNNTDRDALTTVLNPNSGWLHTDIAAAILHEHPTFSTSVGGAHKKVAAHRNGKCSCEPR